MTVPVDLMGQTWYATEADYLTVRAAVEEDAADWHETYAGWRSAAERGEVRLLAQGIATVRINIDPAIFIPWCRGLQRVVNEQACDEFAAMLLLDAQGADGGDVFKLDRLPPSA